MWKLALIYCLMIFQLPVPCLITAGKAIFSEVSWRTERAVLNKQKFR